MFITDVVIIGAGPVGLFAIFQCGMHNLKVHVFDGLPHVGGQCSALYPEKPIYDIPAHPSILAQELVDQLYAQASVYDPTFHFSSQVTDIIETPTGWIVKSNRGVQVEAKAIIIAAGAGAFGPNRPPLDAIQQFEPTSVHYSVRHKEIYGGKNIVIAGGGDSAVDWALALEPIAKSVTLVHRRSKFKAAPQSEEKLKASSVRLVVPYQLHAVEGVQNQLQTVIVQSFDDGSLLKLEADYLLPFFGLSTNLGPISEWGLGLEKNTIDVDQSTSKTNKNMVYAIGDVASYPHKMKLILTGFAEAAQAAQSIYRTLNPDAPLHTEHSTTKGIPSKSVGK